MKIKCQEEAIAEARTEAEEDQIYLEVEEEEIIRGHLQGEEDTETSHPEKTLEVDLLLREVATDHLDKIFKIQMIIKFMLPGFPEKLLSMI